MTTAQAPLRQSLGAVMKQTFEVEPGTPPEFAQYLRTIASDRLVALAAWRDVREKAVRLRRDSQVHVEVYKPEVITARVEGDHGTYYTTVQRLGAYPGGPSRLRESSISGWSCECEWGHWAWIRKRTFVGRMCSHALALTYEMQSRDHSRRRDKGKPIRVRQGPSTPGGQGGTRTRMTLSSANRKMWTRQSSTNWAFVTEDPYHPTAVISRTASGFKAFVYPDGLSQFSLALGTFKNSEGARRAIGRVINSAIRPDYQNEGNDSWSDEEWDDFLGDQRHPEAPRHYDPSTSLVNHPNNPRRDPRQYSDPDYIPGSSEFPWRDQRQIAPPLEDNRLQPSGPPPSQRGLSLNRLQPGTRVNLKFRHGVEPATFHGVTGEGHDQRAHFTQEDHDGRPYDWEAYKSEHISPGRWLYGSSADRLGLHSIIEGPEEGYTQPPLRHESFTRVADDDHKMYGRPIITEEDEEREEGVRRQRPVVGKYGEHFYSSRPVKTSHSPYLSAEGWQELFNYEPNSGNCIQCGTKLDEMNRDDVEPDNYCIDCGSAEPTGECPNCGEGIYSEGYCSNCGHRRTGKTSDYTHGYDSAGNSLAPEDSYDDEVTDGQDEITGMMDPQEVLSNGRVDTSTAPQVTSSFWVFADEKVEGVDDENLRDQPGPSDLFIADEKTLGDAPFIEDFDRGPDAQDFWGGEDFQFEQRASSVTLPGGKKINPTHPLAHRSKHGGQSITRQAGKDYSMAEQQALVDEPGVARNASQLNLQGTHYSQLSEEDTSINFL